MIATEPPTLLDDTPRCYECGNHGSPGDAIHPRYIPALLPEATTYLCDNWRKCEERQRENRARRAGGYTGDPASDYGLR